jgi:hypothetical protein
MSNAQCVVCVKCDEAVNNNNKKTITIITTTKTTTTTTTTTSTATHLTQQYLMRSKNQKTPTTDNLLALFETILLTIINGKSRESQGYGTSCSKSFECLATVGALVQMCMFSRYDFE